MKFLVFLLVPIGLLGGLAGGHFLAPPPPEEEVEEQAADHGEDGDHQPMKTKEAGVRPKPKEVAVVDGEPTEYAKITRQFVVPVIEKDRVDSLIVLNIAIEVGQGQSGLIAEHEPKLRDEFLTVLFEHAQSGGFSGEFTKPSVLADLRLSLNESSSRVLGDASRQVLITNIVRQDLE